MFVASGYIQVTSGSVVDPGHLAESSIAGDVNPPGLHAHARAMQRQ